MLNERSLTILGDSHVLALRYADKEQKRFDVSYHPTTGLMLLQSFATEHDDRIQIEFKEIDGHLAQKFDLNREPIVFSGPFHTSRLARQPDWLKHCPVDIWNGHKELLPVLDEELAAYCSDYYKHMFDFLAAAKKADFAIAVLEAPKLLHRVKTYWKGDMEVLAAVDAKIRELVRFQLNRLGIPIIDTPAETYEGNFTKLQYSSPSQTDIHHGNVEYGQLAFKKIEEWVDSLRS